jgi:hypothetical protein
MLLGAPADALQQHQQALDAHLQLQQHTSGAAVAAAEFPSVNLSQGGSGEGFYQSPFLMGAPPAQPDRHTGSEAVMPPTTDAGTIHVSLACPVTICSANRTLGL